MNLRINLTEQAANNNYLVHAQFQQRGKCPPCLVMGMADASGAIRGAVIGFLGGPASPITVFAGALVGAGAASAARGFFMGF